MKKHRKLQIIGGGYLEVQEILNRIDEDRLPVMKVQIAAEGDRIGEIHEYGSEPLLVTPLGDITEGGYDAALLLSPIENLQKLTRCMVMGNTPLIDMAGQFEPGPEIPVLLPDMPDFDLHGLPMVSIVPTGFSHVITTLVHALGEAGSWQDITGCMVQGVSRMGSRQGMDELFDQIRAIMGFKEIEITSFPYQTAFNVFHAGVDDFRQRRVCEHVRYVAGNPGINVAVDCMWGSFFVGMIGTAWLRAAEPVDRDFVKSALTESLGFRLEDHFGGALEVVGSDTITLSNITVAEGDPCRLTLRFGMDNLRRGLATTISRLFRAAWSEE
ncbi:MAG TPA: hypothetical protein PLV45_00450 [bacterium]|nr:hypothetical protein [bacterium]